ncbi:ImmA/IrrE family metallo-endopeptidase [Bradyrhizobium sp. SZCCHNRI3043]|uniref:ImmA/IrrE family metallo-endopeptidase n=1 Tax=Bradyrhizobium sp. SZCCHNRI3043 TaxID=3057292 RepID=UPI0028EDC410|nr:ImmA/IrrE family metallo-endopeptidase [Bradyrhizobium sp. SZCCHNRI3043]
MAPDYRLVMAKAREVLRANFISEPPVSPIEIAQSYGLKVLFADFSGGDISDVSGFLDLGGSTIFVNKDEPARRQTFTIAHELGHALLHRDLFLKHPEEYKVLLRAPIGLERDPLEQEANAFAAHLLVPAAFLEKYSKIASNAELARLFNVSEDVIRFRKAYESKYKAA